MKKLLLLLSLLFIFGCANKTDENGFYIEGKNIGIHKETNTRYDKDGFDKDGWSESKLVNKETKTEYDKDGYNYYGFDKDGLNKDTGTNYDINGFAKDGFNEEGIHKITGFNFDEEGFTKERTYYGIGYGRGIEKPYFIVSDILMQKKVFFETEYDKFDGITYIERSYYPDLCDLAWRVDLAVGLYDEAQRTGKDKDYINAHKHLYEVANTINNKFYIDIISNYGRDNKVRSFFRFTFFSSEKEYNVNAVELLGNGSIVKINDFVFNSHIVEIDLILRTMEVPLYLNQIDIPVTDDLFNWFAKLKKDQKIDVRIVTKEDNRFTWTNEIEKDKGLPIGLGKYYQLINAKDKN